jgi:hypothetical protein
VFEFGCHLNLDKTWPNEAQHVVKELAAYERSLDHQGQFFFILDPAQRLNHGRGQS